MRLGRGGQRLPRPNQIAGYGCIALGGLIVLLILPFHFWVAGLGGLLGYLGWRICRRP